MFSSKVILFFYTHINTFYHFTFDNFLYNNSTKKRLDAHFNSNHVDNMRNKMEYTTRNVNALNFEY